MAAEIASDESLVIESPRPGDGVLTALYEQHYDHLLRLASLISAGIDAEDLVQETYVRALRRWDSQRPVEAFPAWAHTTMVRIHLNHLRRALVERRARRLLGSEDYLEPPASTSDTFAALKTITSRRVVAV